VAEQRFCKPLVGSSNLSPGTTFNSSQATPRQHKVNAEGRADTVRINGPTVKVLLVLAWAFGSHKMTATAQASGACKYMSALPPKADIAGRVFLRLRAQVIPRGPTSSPSPSRIIGYSITFSIL
jgi:hypothetical protein